MMIDEGVDPQINEAFVTVCADNDISKAIYFLDMGADINYRDGEALIYAMYNNSTNTIEMLLAHGILLTDDIFTCAIENNKLDIINKSIYYVPITKKHIIAAIVCENLDIIKIFLNADTNPDDICLILFELMKNHKHHPSPPAILNILKLLNTYQVEFGSVITKLTNDCTFN